MVLTESQFSLEALPYRQAIRQQRERRIAAGDTLRRRTQTTRRRIDSGRKWIRSLPQTVSYANGRLGDK